MPPRYVCAMIRCLRSIMAFPNMSPGPRRLTVRLGKVSYRAARGHTLTRIPVPGLLARCHTASSEATFGATAKTSATTASTSVSFVRWFMTQARRQNLPFNSAFER